MAAAALLASCHKKGGAPAADSLIGRAQAVSKRIVTPAVDTKLPPPLKSSLVVKVPDRSVGPFLARRGGTVMTAYLGPNDAGTRQVVAVPLGPDGAPRDPKIVATTLKDSTTLVLRPAGGEGTGFVAAWTELTERGEALLVTGVGADGTARTPPVELARTTDDVVWVDLAPTPRGEVCVWAEETRANDANILAVALDPAGKPRGVPSRIATGVTAWQITPTAAGAALALVTTPDPKSPKAAIQLLRLDPEGRPAGPGLPVASAGAKVTDVDMARVGDSLVLAWTDRAEPDPEVWLATVDDAGKPQPARAVTSHTGGSKLDSLLGGKEGGLILWEDARKRPRAERRLHLAGVDPRGVMTTPAAPTLETEASGVPEVAALDDGYALLVRSRTCPDPLGPKDTPCAETAPVPVLLRMDRSLAVVQTEPVRIDEGQEIASMAWGLSCEETRCLVLAAGQEQAVTVRAVLVTETPNRWRAPALPAEEGRKVAGVESVMTGDVFADVAVSEADDGALLAALTRSDEEPAQGTARGGTISVRPLDASGVPRGGPQVLTKRASAVGGVSVAGGKKVDGGAVAWAAREGSQTQIHVSRVDKAGKRTKDVQLTTSSGAASEPAIAWAGGGWVVAWVDTRDGNGEVYATKVDTTLNRIAREERITNAPGDATDIVLLGGGDKDIWVGWADPRDSPHDGFADIFAARLSAVTAKPASPEARVLSTAAHSRSPALAWAEDGKVSIAWIEEAPMSAGSDNSGAYGAMIATLDDKAHVVGDVLKTKGAGDGFPTSVAIEQARGGLRVALARAAQADLSLDVMEVVGGRESTPVRVFSLDGPPSLDVALTLFAGAAYFNDEGTEPSDGRVRRLAVAWSR